MKGSFVCLCERHRMEGSQESPVTKDNSSIGSSCDGAGSFGSLHIQQPHCPLPSAAPQPYPPAVPLHHETHKGVRNEGTLLDEWRLPDRWVQAHWQLFHPPEIGDLDCPDESLMLAHALQEWRWVSPVGHASVVCQTDGIRRAQSPKARTSNTYVTNNHKDLQCPLGHSKQAWKLLVMTLCRVRD